MWLLGSAARWLLETETRRRATVLLDWPCFQSETLGYYRGRGENWSSGNIAAVIGEKGKFSYAFLSFQMLQEGQDEHQWDKSSPVSPIRSQPSSYTLHLSPSFSPLPKSPGVLLLGPFCSHFHPFFSNHMYGLVCKNGALRDSWSSSKPNSRRKLSLKMNSSPLRLMQIREPEE